MDQFNFDSYPSTNFNEINLTWILETIVELKRIVEEDHPTIVFPIAVNQGGTGATTAEEARQNLGIGGGGGGVTSVNGKTGVVVLIPSDIGALPDSYTPPVQSVNGQTGAVNLSIPQAATSAPADLGASAAVGNGTTWARSNHVHKRPTLSELGAMAAVTGTAVGQVLTWTGSAWAAQALPLYTGSVI